MNDGSDDKTLLSDGDAVPTQVDGDESYCAACGSSYPIDVHVCPKDGARLTKLKAQPDALLGRVFDGRFEVRTTLGQGGMGTVYRGWQITVDREIAIKVIHPKLASDRIAVKRFLREARLSSRLNQPNIVNVYDFGQTEDGILFIAMELLRGHTLGRELESMRPMAMRRVLTIAQQLCDALDSAHNQGIVHRDLKPNNIVILDDPPGRDLIKVLDFGLAKSLITDTSSRVTNTNAMLGTPLYMPPEQIEGRPSDQRADLYSLGCILFQMLTGKPPFLGDNVNAVLKAHVSDPPPPLPATVPAPIANMVAKLMEKVPAKRVSSARDVRETLQAVLEGGTAYPTGEVYDTTPDARPMDSGQIALAETHAAASNPSASSQAGAVPLSITQDKPVAPSRLRWLAPALVAAIVAGGVAVYLLMKPAGGGGEAKQPVVVAPDAAASVAPMGAEAAAPNASDAAPEPPDAAIVDAVIAPLDAGKKPKQPKPRPSGGSGSAATVKPDAGATEPQLDFIKRDAGG